VKNLGAAAGQKAGTPDLPAFRAEEKVGRVVSRRSWDIQFDSGNARFTPQATGRGMAAIYGSLGQRAAA
jgi:hypothetical protein